MRKNLMLLEELQELDLKIDGRHGEKQSLLDQLAALDERVESVRQTVNEKREELTLLEDERRTLAQNLVTENENIARSEVRQREIKTQKEYQAVLKEVSAAKKQKNELEELLQQKATQIDELAGEIAAREEELNSLEANIDGQKAEIQGNVDRLEQEIAVDAAAKESTAKGIPASLMKRYLALRERRQGVAIVVARDGNCSGCNMNLPPQLYNSLYRSDELILCPHCQRMLVLRQEA